MNNFTSGYYICELNSKVHKGTYKRKVYYDDKTKKFTIENSDVTDRVVKIIEKAYYDEVKIL